MTTATVAPEIESPSGAPASAEIESPKLAAVIAEFPSAAAVTEAARKIRAAGVSGWDVHSPFPIHGIDDVIGIRPTRLPWITLCAGATGICVALLMQWWMNAVDYPFWISGKPFFGLPAAVPVAFELMILFAAISTLLSMLLLNGLPRFSNPLFSSDRFLRATSDRFFICFAACDPTFDREKVQKLLTECHATGVDECFAPPASDKQWPSGIRAGLAVVFVLALIPPVLIAQKRATTTTEPRFHAVPDMDFQPKFKPQRASTLFADGRAMRPQPAGTIARGDLRADSRLYKGLESPEGQRALAESPRTPGSQAVTRFVSADASESNRLVAQADPAAAPAGPADPLDSQPWVKTFPVPMTAKTMKRGQERYNIYCAACHGLGGDGDGLVTRRALELEQGTWIKPTTFHSDNLRNQPIGRVFHSITNGVRKMPKYGDLIPVEDRWAIVLYVRALQQSRHADVKDVPSDLVPQLRDLPKE
ncbi:quinol:electron acceptor oxidoreductase subunit ActD [Schlesneria paludicola]|uniref:quinol:electron acceptor oxidoreductase subunit ActD n=1 Tax=Schlesneria paludicola TaxID=360056 RepID=UPI00029B1B26|nr:quinol:electron acceptor oxidoreductase subunit ActD [Schlesneria paludicola]